MSTLVVGSVALDTVETPYGRAEEALGGTAVYFSLAASLLTDVLLVGVVGSDYPEHGIALLHERNVDLAGLQQQPGETFRWVGEYTEDMNIAHTLDTRLNVFESFHPSIPEHYRDARFVFLGNIDPVLQLEVLRQVRNPVFTALDTMNFWIELKRDALTEAMKQVDAILINEGEIREYTGYYSVLQAARALQDIGPQVIVVKRGEYGSLLFAGDEIFACPAYPTFHVRDTTGAGDSFAGGFLGYLEHAGDVSGESLRAAAVCGTVMASYTVEDFSIAGLQLAHGPAIHDRYQRLADITRVSELVPLVTKDLVTEGV